MVLVCLCVKYHRARGSVALY